MSPVLLGAMKGTFEVDLQLPLPQGSKHGAQPRGQDAHCPASHSAEALSPARGHCAWQIILVQFLVSIFIIIVTVVIALLRDSSYLPATLSVCLISKARSLL